MKIAVFGAGMVARKILSFNLRNGNEIVLVVDNNEALWSKDVSGYSIENPLRLREANYDLVMIAVSRGWMDIREQIISYGIPESKIFLTDGWSRAEYYVDELDRYFDIPKKPFVPFRKTPVTSLGHCGGESEKSRPRREREGFFEKYCQGDGLDIGCGNDPVVHGVSGWDLQNGDAQYLKGVPNESFDFVYSSHCLEHMNDVRIALKNWFRVVKPGGYLLLYIPHRDLYEKRMALPSRWNPHHKHMFLIGEGSADVLDIVEEISMSLTGYRIQYVKVCDEGHTIDDPLIHSDGEYSIEIVVQKKKE